VDCLSRRKFLNLTALGLMPLGIGCFVLSACAEAHVLEVYKSPSCGCCGAWVDHMRSAGFQVVVTDITDLRPIKNKFGVVPELRACHSAVIDGYVIEGHVPSREVMRLLKERPKAIGLAVPGMPIGSPVRQGWNREAAAIHSRSFFFHQRAIRFLLHTRSNKYCWCSCLEAKHIILHTPHRRRMTRLIIPALVALLVSGPAWGETV